ncbi:AbrB/MazE/SpoVT family DNA-binding domain-containing protein [Nesterenkonia muleiensis]|uniref:AbrB/MazE/SpoVT family DNA-binding domain-containing protein n=1 Tax=Nesterenkonia muleiensis TaxID=2282648 RepID=UPI000E726FAA|nr:AbrB/MazE/SpoVT family DNA-binding domain-containing protein [Nesterenkonia muleiensis]
MSIATVTSKAQITIPKEIRERFRIEPGMQLHFWENSRGRLEVTPRNRSWEDTFRWADENLSASTVSFSTEEELNDAIADAVASHALDRDDED